MALHLTDESVPCERQVYSEELKAEVRRRHASGETIPQLAELTGIPFGMVKFIWGNTKREPELALRRNLAT